MRREEEVDIGGQHQQLETRDAERKKIGWQEKRLRLSSRLRHAELS